MLNFLACVNEFIFSFFPLCLVLAYHGYTNVNIKCKCFCMYKGVYLVFLSVMLC